MNTNDRICIGYTRCSTKKQDEEDKAFGRAVQMRAISAYAEFKGHSVDKWIHDTCSGSLLERKGLDEIRELARLGKVATILFPRQDRLARDAHVAETIYKEFAAYDVSLVNVEMNFDDSMYGRILRRILDNFAELDRIQIVERTNNGRIEAVKKYGTHIYGYRVLGYRLIHSEEAERRGLPNGSLEIIEKEAEIVKLVYALRELGYSYGSIARWLNKKGFQTKTGSRFCDNTVFSIIKGEGFYRAERVGVCAEALGLTDEEYKAIRPAHPPILPARLAGQETLTKRMHRSKLGATDIPDDPFAVAPQCSPRKPKQFHSLPRHYGDAIIRCVELQETGMSFRRTAKTLNGEGHLTRFGRRFRDQSVIDIMRRIKTLLPLANEAVQRPLVETGPLKTNEWTAPVRLARQLAKQGLSRKRGGMSLCKIAEHLNAEFGATPNGSQFYPETVRRLLTMDIPEDAPLKTVAYARLTRDGKDLLGQIDEIDSWAAKHDIEISDWYVDRGAAYKSVDNPEIQRLLRDATAGGIGRIAVLGLERVCSDITLAEETIRILNRSAEVVLVGELQKFLAPKRKKVA